MALKSIPKTTDGKGRRRCHSWIDQFVEWTANLEAAPLFRKWSAITAIAAVLEQKVWVKTTTLFYPNLYTVLVGNPGIGKSRSITAVTKFVRDLNDIALGATSMTMASLVDILEESKKSYVNNIGAIPTEYNSLFISVDELSAFMHEYSKELVAGLTAFYDTNPYFQARRGRDIRAVIPRPQLNILTGTTPANLLNLIPANAWSQGLTSRIILIYSKDHPLVDVFNVEYPDEPEDLIHDFKLINKLHGEFGWTKAYAKAMNDWRVSGMGPMPTHPRLESYNARRYSHLIKLTMISSVDRSDSLILEEEDCKRAISWLLEAEGVMEVIFETTENSKDAQALEEILYYIKGHAAHGVPESSVIGYAAKRLNYAAHASAAVGVLIASRKVLATQVSESGLRWLVATEFISSAPSKSPSSKQ